MQTTLTKTYLVRRSFRVGDTTCQPGEVLDTETWPTNRARQLAEQRYIEPMPYEAPSPVACKCGRLWSLSEPFVDCPITTACTNPRARQAPAGVVGSVESVAAPVRAPRRPADKPKE